MCVGSWSRHGCVVVLLVGYDEDQDTVTWDRPLYGFVALFFYTCSMHSCRSSPSSHASFVSVVHPGPTNVARKNLSLFSGILFLVTKKKPHIYARATSENFFYRFGWPVRDFDDSGEEEEGRKFSKNVMGREGMDDGQATTRQNRGGAQCRARRQGGQTKRRSGGVARKKKGCRTMCEETITIFS